MRSTWFTAPLRLLIIAGLPLSLGACASRPAQQSSGDQQRALSPAVAPSIAELETLARRQAARPASVDLPPPSGLDAALVAPLSPAPPEATIPLSELLPTLAAEVPVKPIDAPPAPADPDATEAALRFYARAQAALYADKPANAIGFLDEAAKADPSRPEIWLLRGDILSNSSQRFGATAAYQRVLDLGRVEPRACFALGISAIDRADHAAGARYLAAVITHHADGEDPALPIIAYSSLGTSLYKLGHVRAGNEALAIATGTGLQFTATTAYRIDLQTLSRRRSDLARDMGDGWARLGMTQEALDAYERAAALPSFDPSAITERRVYLLARSGRPAEAALTLLDDIVRAELRIDDRHLSLLHALATHTDLGPTLARAVAELPALAGHLTAREGLPAPRITPTIEGRLARAAVAIHPASARPVLESYLARNPDDDAVAREWVTLLEATPAQAIPVAASLLERQPLVALNIGRRFSQSPLGATIVSSDELRSASATSSPHASLLASLLISRGQWSEASRVLRVSPRAPSEVGLIAQALLAAAAGDDALASDLLSSVVGSIDRARVLLAQQRPDDAKTALAESSPDRQSVSSLMLGAEIAILHRDGEGAESQLRRAVELDPFDEALYERLAGLYRQGAPLADQEKLFAVYRDLRDAVPSSRLLRTLNAQDAAQRGQFGLAEQELTSLLQLEPEDTRALQTLVTVWERLARTDTGVADRATALLVSLRQARPGSTVLAIAQARALTAAGRVAEARVLLEQQLETCPTPELASALETILSEGLSLPAEATQHALMRLSPSPRPIDTTIELVRVLASAGSLAEAASVLEREIPASAVLTPAQGTQLQLLVAEVGPTATTPQGAAKAPDTLRLLAAVASRTTALAPGIHELRVSLLASDPNATAEQLIGAIEDARSDAPSLGPRPTRMALGKLLEAERNDIALAVAINEIEKSEAPDPELALVSVRLVVNTGNAAQLERILATLKTLDDAAKVLSPIHPDGDLALAPDATIDQARAEIAFIVANAISLAEDRTNDSFDVYRLALRYNPSHAMAANNLGYTLLEHGAHLDEAAALLELAYRLEPDDANVVDSLGWLRYQQGRIEDVTEPDGSITEGAISLLQKALIIDADGGSPVSLDHYADALWAGGQREDAIEQWQNALSALERRMSDLASAGRSDPDHPAMLAALNAKILAAKEGREPAIAPRRLANSHGVTDGRP